MLIELGIGTHFLYSSKINVQINFTISCYCVEKVNHNCIPKLIMFIELREFILTNLNFAIFLSLIFTLAIKLYNIVLYFKVFLETYFQYLYYINRFTRSDKANTPRYG